AGTLAAALSRSTKRETATFRFINLRASSAPPMATLPFVKMHGIGNDYVYVDCFTHRVPDPAALAQRVSPRRTAIGSDGLILICPSDVADARMEMYNADGSRGAMCGNGIRCVGKYVAEQGLSANNPLRIETDCGIKLLELTRRGGEVV